MAAQRRCLHAHKASVHHAQWTEWRSCRTSTTA
uniref:Uncharacterized protein n=1 Tax=Arundo donax TaxID=35708 RepID=A0A0A8ZQA1_ARUDO